jgi:hypothetical protein
MQGNLERRSAMNAIIIQIIITNKGPPRESKGPKCCKFGHVHPNCPQPQKKYEGYKGKKSGGKPEHKYHAMTKEELKTSSRHVAETQSPW